MSARAWRGVRHAGAGAFGGCLALVLGLLEDDVDSRVWSRAVDGLASGGVLGLAILPP